MKKKFIRYPVVDMTDRRFKDDRKWLIATCIALLIGLVWTAYTGHQRATYWYGKYIEAVNDPLK